MSNFAPVDEQLAYIKKGAAEIIREAELRAKLEKSRATGKPLRVKRAWIRPRPTFIWATPSCCASSSIFRISATPSFF